MSAARWPEIEALLDAALDLPHDARASLLDDPAAGDAQVRAEVRRLLAQAAGAAQFLEQSASEYAAPLLADVHGSDVESAAAPPRVGPYRIIREIGRGGMGAVYLAERDDDQFRMQVALKLVPLGMDSEHARRRFREERQILASLDHPHIARLLDGGVTDNGLPWFALEHVAGIPIDRYCQEQQLTLDARLDLFCVVCEAVAYAHRNLVVHRDIKPGNILVTDDGLPKLLDFGIAKLIDAGPATQSTPSTRTHLRAMTVEYGSPEQLRGGPITTATDVYSLGVLLYELLAGRRPYRLADRSAADVERIVCELEPPPPSTALSASSSAGSDRRSRRLRGDLDTIVLMALRKEPERRYASAGQLAGDIRRHVAGMPVSAQRDTRRYRVAKFLRRHRVAVAVATVLTLSLAGGLAGTAWQARHAMREASRATAVTSFLAGMFEAEQPEQALGREVTARELLDQGAARIDADLAGQPAVQAELLGVLASTYISLGLFDDAQPLVDRALALRRALHGEHHVAVATARHLSARLLFERGDYDAAEAEYREVLVLRRRLRGRWHPDVTRTANDLASTLMHKGEYGDAELLYREVLASERRMPGAAALEVATALSNLGVLLHRKGDYAEAEAVHREALVLRQSQLHHDHPDLVTSLFNLAAVQDDLGDPAAEQVYRDVLERRRRIYRGAHPVLAATLENLSGVLSRRGELNEAGRYSNEAVDMKLRMLGDEHPDVAAALNNLAVLEYRAGDLTAAARHMGEALRIWREVFGSAHPNVAAALNNMGGILNEAGDHGSAEPLLVEAVMLRREMLGAAHPDVAQTLRNLGIARHAAGDAAQAEAHFREALDIYRRAFPGGHLRTAEVLLAYGALLRDRRPLDAEAALLEALQIRQAVLADDDRRIGLAAAALVDLYESTDRAADATPYRALLRP